MSVVSDGERELLEDALGHLEAAIAAFHYGEEGVTRAMTEAVDAEIAKTSYNGLKSEMEQARMALAGDNIWPRDRQYPQEGIVWLAPMERVHGALNILLKSSGANDSDGEGT